MRARTFVGLLALCVVAAFGTQAGAAGGVSINTTARSGDALTVGGGSAFESQPNLVLGTDAGNDGPPGFANIGGDLVAMGLSTTIDGETKLRMTWGTAPGLNGTPPVSYGWSFCVSGGDCFELTMQRLTFGTQNTLPTSGDSVLYRCATAACVPDDRTAVTTGWIPIFFDGQGLTATLPSAIGAAPGGTITSISVDPKGAVYSALGFANPATMQAGSGDGIDGVAAYTVPRREVSLAVAGPGLAPQAVDYATTVVPAPNGSWSASLDVAGRSGNHTVYARACYGANNCAYTTRDLAL